MKGLLLRFYRAPLFSPQGMFLRGVEIALIFFLLHALGLRQYTSIISGTRSPGGAAWYTLLGVTYAAAYLGFVLLAPVLVLASAICLAACRLTERRGPEGPTTR